MRISGTFSVAMLLAALSIPGCTKTEDPVENAIESTKDALNIREHEKLKDAGEHVSDAVDDAAEGVKDAVRGD